MVHRLLGLAGGFSALAAAVLVQSSAPSELLNQHERLSKATSIRATLSVTPTSGPPKTVEVYIAKPSQFRIEQDGLLIIGDGKKVIRYFPSSKTYTSVDQTKEEVAKVFGEPDLWLIAPSLWPEAWNDVASAKRTGTRRLSGQEFTELTLAFKTPGKTAVVYQDTKAQLLRSVAGGVIVAATNLITSGDQTLAPANLFAFVPPAGATMLDPNQPKTVSYSEVQAIFNRSCFPCHGQQGRGGYTFLNYETTMASRGAVNVSNPDESFIIRSLRGIRAQRMPRDRAPLPPEQIQKIYDWMKAGAKKD